MTPAAMIEQELAAAEAAWQGSNDGKARVCARRAVARATEVWLARLPLPRWHGDAMGHLRQIQQDVILPLPIRQAAERLSTPVTRQHTSPFTEGPIAERETHHCPSRQPHFGQRATSQSPTSFSRVAWLILKCAR